MVVFAIPAWILWTALAALVTFYAGIRAGDKDWPWESANADDDDPFTIPEIPLPEGAKKALGGLLLLGALILGAVALKGRGK